MDKLVMIARLVGTFGVRGQVVLRSFASPDDGCVAYGPLLDADRQIRITPTRHVRRSPGYFLVTPREQLSREEWQALKGLDLYTAIDNLAPLADGEFHAASLIGCTVEHADGRYLGQIRALQDFGAGEVIDIVCGEVTYMLPFTHEIATDIRLSERRIVSHCQDDWLPTALRARQTQ